MKSTRYFISELFLIITFGFLLSGCGGSDSSSGDTIKTISVSDGSIVSVEENKQLIINFIPPKSDIKNAYIGVTTGYDYEPDDNAYFEQVGFINSNTFQIKFKELPDYETKNQYKIEIITNYKDGSQTKAYITVNITDIYEDTETNTVKLKSEPYVFIPKEENILIGIGSTDNTDLLLLETEDSSDSRSVNRALSNRSVTKTNDKIKSMTYRDLKKDSWVKISYDSNGNIENLIGSDGYKFDISNMTSSGYTVTMYDSTNTLINSDYVSLRTNEKLKLSPFGTSLIFNPDSELKTYDFSSLINLTPSEAVNILATTASAITCGAGIIASASVIAAPVGIPATVIACGNLGYNAIDTNFDLSKYKTQNQAINVSIDIAKCGVTYNASNCQSAIVSILDVGMDNLSENYDKPITEILNSLISDTTSPVFTSNNTASVNENQTGAITLVATDDNTITYSISSGDSASFDVDSSTGVVTFKTEPDYETNQNYSFTAKASDGMNEITQSIIITIVDIDEQAKEDEFSRNGNIVTDSKTGLMWQDNVDAKDLTFNFDNAENYCQDLTLDGYSDWQLPTITQLSSLTNRQELTGDYVMPYDSKVKPKVFENYYFGGYRTNIFDKFVYFNESPIHFNLDNYGCSDMFNEMTDTELSQCYKDTNLHVRCFRK
ncbi:MAG: DUF1566 domain-containing protein [Campylobacterota bacterium]|nr:DUF1566 domain-containing protein [Campylobacterota bacterium]